ncbi:MAG: Uma2 family endonuclease [Planctomycetes bacterium]|nr:Uma2 family endonuclease [Planctomycetota bacterium]
MAGFAKETQGTAPAERRAVPPLQPGDRLSRPEFERRYAAMPDGIKAELVEGVVYIMPSPVRKDRHGKPHFVLIGWLAVYQAGTPGVEGADNSTVRLDLDNEPQPDIFLRILPEHGGQSRTSEDDYVEGAPELVAEIAATSASYDLHDKLRAYRRNGVREYIVWRTEDEAIDWFALEEGEFVPIAPDENGMLRSRVFPGLWLDPRALLARDLKRVFDVAGRGLASPDHKAFAERLARAGTSGT